MRTWGEIRVLNSKELSSYFEKHSEAIFTMSIGQSEEYVLLKKERLDALINTELECVNLSARFKTIKQFLDCF